MTPWRLFAPGSLPLDGQILRWSASVDRSWCWPAAAAPSPLDCCADSSIARARRSATVSASGPLCWVYSSLRRRRRRHPTCSTYTLGVSCDCNRPHPSSQGAQRHPHYRAASGADLPPAEASEPTAQTSAPHGEIRAGETSHAPVSTGGERGTPARERKACCYYKERSRE